MDPKKFFAELTRRNGYKIAKSCFLLGRAALCGDNPSRSMDRKNATKRVRLGLNREKDVATEEL